MAQWLSIEADVVFLGRGAFSVAYRACWRSRRLVSRAHSGEWVSWLRACAAIRVFVAVQLPCWARTKLLSCVTG